MQNLDSADTHETWMEKNISCKYHHHLGYIYINKGMFIIFCVKVYLQKGMYTFAWCARQPITVPNIEN